MMINKKQINIVVFFLGMIGLFLLIKNFKTEKYNKEETSRGNRKLSQNKRQHYAGC